MWRGGVKCGLAVAAPFVWRCLTSRVGLRIDLFDACSAFTRFTACTFALSPYFATRLSEGFNHFVCSMMLRLLPAGAVAGWGLHPLEKRRPITAHAKVLTGR